MLHAPAANALSGNVPQTVTDVSWPNCAAVVDAGSTAGIVGVNGGLDFRPNRCLNSETKLFDSYELYVNTGYPGTAYGKKFSDFPRSCKVTDKLCLAYNYGYNAAKYSVNYADTQLAHTFMWWLDVETSNSWTGSVAQNRAVLTGMVAGLQRYAFLPTIGFYSYPGQWSVITGNWRNGFPNWTATGTSSYQTAISFCQGQNFTGGSTWLAQYTTKLDHNYICNSGFLQHIKISRPL
jgi:hypothetical protein